MTVIGLDDAPLLDDWVVILRLFSSTPFGDALFLLSLVVGLSMVLVGILVDLITMLLGR